MDAIGRRMGTVEISVSPPPHLVAAAPRAAGAHPPRRARGAGSPRPSSCTAAGRGVIRGRGVGGKADTHGSRRRGGGQSTRGAPWRCPFRARTGAAGSSRWRASRPLVAARTPAGCLQAGGPYRPTAYRQPPRCARLAWYVPPRQETPRHGAATVQGKQQGPTDARVHDSTHGPDARQHASTSLPLSAKHTPSTPPPPCPPPCPPALTPATRGRPR